MSQQTNERTHRRKWVPKTIRKIFIQTHISTHTYIEEKKRKYVNNYVEIGNRL